MRRLPLWTTVLIVCAGLFVLPQVRAQEPETTMDPAFSTEQIEQLVAPIALYPDSLVAQILMAATYPLEIVQAARWQEKNPDLKGTNLEQALASENWDPSVKALTNFPDVLKRMSDNLDWTQDLGDAVLAQEHDVMDAVQHMRWLAYDADNLKTTPEQKVIVQEKVIVVEPASEVVYVPVYSPTVVYGTAWVPTHYYYPIYSYPPSYWYPPGYAASNIIAFGVGMAVGAAVWNNWNWGHCNWHGGSVNINNNFNFNRNINTGNINIGNKAGGGKYSKWEHNASHRDGVRYRDTATQQRFGKAERSKGQLASIDRDSARGFDRAGSREAKRPETRETKGAKARDVPRSQSRDTAGTQGRSASRDTPRAQSRDTGSRGSGQSGAFNVGGSFDRAASNRGASSRGLGGGSRGGGAARGGGRR
jgi:hypothetical protein